MRGSSDRDRARRSRGTGIHRSSSKKHGSRRWRRTARAPAGSRTGAGCRPRPAARRSRSSRCSKTRSPCTGSFRKLRRSSPSRRHERGDSPGRMRSIRPARSGRDAPRCSRLLRPLASVFPRRRGRQRRLCQERRATLPPRCRASSEFPPFAKAASEERADSMFSARTGRIEVGASGGGDRRVPCNSLVHSPDEATPAAPRADLLGIFCRAKFTGRREDERLKNLLCSPRLPAST